MSDIYSALLGFALMSLVASCVCFFLRKPALCRATGILGFLLSAMAGIVHFVTDHSASATNPMRLKPFFAEHPAILIIGILSAALSVGASMRKRL